MDIYKRIGLKEILSTIWYILKDGSLLSIAKLLSFIPQLLVSIFSGHLGSIEIFETASLYLFINATLGSGSIPFAIGTVSCAMFLF